MKSKFVFSGQSSDDYCLTIEYMPSYSTAKKNIDTYSVPGRSGALIFDTGTFGNVTQSYEVWLKAPSGMNTHQTAREIANWLLGQKGYQRLEDTYDPEVYRKAYFSGPVDVENWFGKYGRCKLDFTCMPQRWLKSGEFCQDVASGETLYNNWQPALPLIEISGTGICMFRIGGYLVSVSDIPQDGIVIDCETQNAYSGEVNCNNLITLDSGFPVLNNGENKITILLGDVETLKITPRWWCI